MKTKRQIMEELKKTLEIRKDLKTLKEHDAMEALKKGDMEENHFCLIYLDRLYSEIETLESVINLINENIAPWED